MKTYITLNVHHSTTQLQVHVVRKKHVAVRDLPVSSHSLNSRGLFGMDHTHHVYRGVILQLGLVIVLLVVLVTLHLSHFHVVNQQRIILNAAVANMVALCLLIGQLILVLYKRKTLGMNNIIEFSNISVVLLLAYSQLTLLAMSLEDFAATMGMASSFT